ncbi:prolipoprotein diacylglyceryl transferase [SAR202 cluster bacterium AC-647-N09_OGT_505m]|nr:prolipoprotein diacylglyceryl transferase [SAR202 cluster bacterium AC-647-N09_OGT_505m]
MDVSLWWPVISVDAANIPFSSLLLHLPMPLLYPILLLLLPIPIITQFPPLTVVMANGRIWPSQRKMERQCSMIHIGISPYILSTGGFVLTWHGFFAFVAVAVAVLLVARWAQREGIVSDVIYSTAIWAIVAGMFGARVTHVIDRWDFYSESPGEIVAIWRGGIALYGGILGGFLGGAIYARFQGYPIGRLADVTAPALLIAQTIGRIGDIINGEHLSKVTDLPWGFVYTHPDSLSAREHLLAASHPVIAYEMIWNMIVLGVIWWLWGRIKPDGMIFALYLGAYSFGRFLITFLREDKIWFAGLQEAHLIAIVIIAVTVPLLAYRGRLVSKGEESGPPVGI